MNTCARYCRRSRKLSWLVLRRLLREEDGVIASIDQILLTTIVSLSLLTGLATYRDAYTQELGDIAVALDHLDQSYTYTVNGVQTTYTDTVTLTDANGLPPAGMSVSVVPTEGE